MLTCQACAAAGKQCYLCRRAKMYEWRRANPDAVREIKRRFYASARGKAAKKREDAHYVSTGGRAAVERRRAERGVSPARKAARKKWARANRAYFTADMALRRALDRKALSFDRFVLLEAAKLARLREAATGFAWHVDHIVPVSKGGRSTADNLQVVPATWNRRKSNKHSRRFFPVGYAHA